MFVFPMRVRVVLVLLVRLVPRGVQTDSLATGSRFNLFRVVFKPGGCSMLNTRPLLNMYQNGAEV